MPKLWNYCRFVDLKLSKAFWKENKPLDEEIIELCLLGEVEQEMVDSEEISEAIIACIEQIKSMIRADVDTHTALTVRESANITT